MSRRNSGASDAATRMLKLAHVLFEGGEISTRYVMDRFGISLSTAKRDLLKIEQCLPVITDWRDACNGGLYPARHLTWRLGGELGCGRAPEVGPGDGLVASR